ncbi:hypothetical protein PFISCL1PPCAC_26241, partial [Pristionchus fissidentatus]
WSRDITALNWYSLFSSSLSQSKCFPEWVDINGVHRVQVVHHQFHHTIRKRNHLSGCIFDCRRAGVNCLEAEFLIPNSCLRCGGDDCKVACARLLGDVGKVHVIVHDGFVDARAAVVTVDVDHLALVDDLLLRVDFPELVE